MTGDTLLLSHLAACITQCRNYSNVQEQKRATLNLVCSSSLLMGSLYVGGGNSLNIMAFRMGNNAPFH